MGDDSRPPAQADQVGTTPPGVTSSGAEPGRRPDSSPRFDTSGIPTFDDYSSFRSASGADEGLLQDSLVGTRAGSIRILGVLARGGMGEVYVGEDERLGRKVALKALRGEAAISRESKARFLQEARVLSQLEHPNICRIYDLVQMGDQDFIVMELIQGRSLREAIDAGLDQPQRPGLRGRSRGCWLRPTSGASSTGTSSPRTSWSLPEGR